MPGATIATLQAIIGADISGLMFGLQTARSEISGVGGAMASAGTRIAGVGAGLTAVMAPIRGIVERGTDAFKEFDSSLAEIGARGGLTAEQLEIVRSKALQLGADTAFSANDALNAFLQLTTGGMTYAESLQVIDSVMVGAAAGGMGMGATADALTDIMAAFGLEADNASSVVETLARASGVSSAEMSDLVQGFYNVGPAAKAFGLDVSQTASILGIFNDNGIKGAEAGTQLRSMLLNMSRDTEPVKDAWAALGASMYDANGNIKDIDVIMGQIRNGLKGMSDEETNRILADLGGSYGILGLQALLASNSVQDFRDKMGGAATAAEVAQARTDTWDGKLEALQGSLDSLVINGLTPFIKHIGKPVVEKITDIVGGLSDWAEKNPEVASTLTAIVLGVMVAGPLLVGFGLALAGLSGIVGVGGTLLTGVAGLSSVISGLSAPAWLALLPIGLLVGEIAILIGVLNDPNVKSGLKAWEGVIDNFIIILQKGEDEVDRVVDETLDKLNILFYGHARGPNGELLVQEENQQWMANIEAGNQQAVMAAQSYPIVNFGEEPSLQQQWWVEAGQNLTADLSPTVDKLIEAGIKPSDTLLGLADRGLLSSEELTGLVSMGITHDMSLYELVTGGLFPSASLLILAQGIEARAADMRAAAADAARAAADARWYAENVPGYVPGTGVIPNAPGIMTPQLSGTQVTGETRKGATPPAPALRDSGGPVVGGKEYRVGVPELFMPANTGYAVPLRNLRGGGDVYNINLTVNGVNDPVTLVDMIDSELERRNRANRRAGR